MKLIEGPVVTRESFLGSVAFISMLTLIFAATLTPSAKAADSIRLKIPTKVNGLVVKKNDELLKSFTLTWKASPTSEHVDSYAMYLLNSFFPDNGAELITTTHKYSVILKSWASTRERGKQPKGTIFLVSDAGLIMSVVAHNKYGWGVVPKNAQAPDRSKAPVIPKSLLAKYSASIAFRDWDCTKEVAKYYSQPC